MNRLSYMAAAVALSWTGCVTALAAPDGGSLPAIQRQGEVSYLSGGIGNDEAKTIKRVAGSYPLELEFLRRAVPRDEYLAGVRVTIRDIRDRTVLDATTRGPFLLAVLPEGHYTVTAWDQGHMEHRDVRISSHEHRRVVFEWSP